VYFCLIVVVVCVRGTQAFAMEGVDNNATANGKRRTASNDHSASSSSSRQVRATAHSCSCRGWKGLKAV